MANLQQSATHFADTKPHYALLDGLRGVAALLVVWYHVFEGYQFDPAQPSSRRSTTAIWRLTSSSFFPVSSSAMHTTTVGERH